MTTHQYRVRLIHAPVMLYNGRSFEQAARAMDSITEDRVLERREVDGWRSIISIEGSSCAM